MSPGLKPTFSLFSDARTKVRAYLRSNSIGAYLRSKSIRAYLGSKSIRPYLGSQSIRAYLRSKDKGSAESSDTT